MKFTFISVGILLAFIYQSSTFLHNQQFIIYTNKKGVTWIISVINVFFRGLGQIDKNLDDIALMLIGMIKSNCIYREHGLDIKNLSP